MRNFIRTLAVCIAVISTSIPIMAQQISIVSGKVLNLPEGEKKPRPFPMGETVRIFAFNTVASARDALKALETFLAPRIQAAEQGKFATRTVDEIFAEAEREKG